jgi:hypothetical protein
MTVWNGQAAANLLQGLSLRCHYRKTKSANFSIPGQQPREISISLARKDGVTAYVNRYSATGQVFPVGGIDGISIVKLYPRGYTGVNGNPGIARSVAAENPTLNPKKYDVLRVHVQNEKSLRCLLEWYRAEVTKLT